MAIFAIDHDGTYTISPDTFRQFVLSLREQGHLVYLVTFRFKSECAQIFEELNDVFDAIICTDRQAKSEYLKNAGIAVNVWIEDTPRAIEEGAELIWGYSHPEGVTTVPDGVVANPTETPGVLQKNEVLTDLYIELLSNTTEFEEQLRAIEHVLPSVRQAAFEKAQSESVRILNQQMDKTPLTDMNHEQREKLIGFYRELVDIQVEGDSLSKIANLLKQVKTEYQGK